MYMYMYIYIYSLVGFGALCALGAAGAAGVFENLWKLIFRNSVFIYFWDLRHADMFQPGALTCLLQFVWFGNVLPNRYAIQI